MEDKYQEEGMVTLVCLENGREYRKTVTASIALEMITAQEVRNLFWAGKTDNPCKIIGVECGDDDGFLSASLGEPVEPEELARIIEE